MALRSSLDHPLGRESEQIIIFALSRTGCHLDTLAADFVPMFLKKIIRVLDAFTSNLCAFALRKCCSPNEPCLDKFLYAPLE